MTYVKLTSFNGVTSFVVATSYNIGLPSSYCHLSLSDPGCDIWSDVRLRALPENASSAGIVVGVVFQTPSKLQFHFQISHEIELANYGT